MHLPYLPGVQPDVGETRAYPFGDELSHLLGYVAPVSPEDKQTDDDDPLLDLPGFRIGKRGIEKAFDAQVRGDAGASRVEVNAYGRVIRELSQRSRRARARTSISPSTANCSISPISGWPDESAACIVMDVQTGDVLALSSTPGFDPNLFNVGITQDAVERR